MNYVDISYSVADAIPFKTFREQINIVNQEVKKNRYIEVWDELKVIYSAEKWEKEDN